MIISSRTAGTVDVVVIIVIVIIIIVRMIIILQKPFLIQLVIVLVIASARAQDAHGTYRFPDGRYPPVLETQVAFPPRLEPELFGTFQ